MDNLDFGFLTVIILIVPMLLYAIPMVAIGVGGVLALKKGYPKCGGALMGAAILHLTVIVLNTTIARFFGPSTYGEVYLYIQIVALLASGLMAGGIIGLVLALPRTVRS